MDTWQVVRDKCLLFSENDALNDLLEFCSGDPECTSDSVLSFTFVTCERDDQYEYSV